MKYSEAGKGRVFVIRLEDGDVLHESIETFAREKGISAAVVTALGGADKGSILVVGPETGREPDVKPMKQELEDVHEICGNGTIFPDGEGNPVLHMHLSCGRKNSTITGCVREGVIAWHVIEVIVMELTDSTGVRLPDSATGFKLLVP